MEQNIVIETPRLILRKITIDDYLKVDPTASSPLEEDDKLLLNCRSFVF